MKKRMFAMILAVVLVFTFLPMTTFAEVINNSEAITAETKEKTATAPVMTFTSGGAPSAWVQGYADESTGNFRASQTLEVKASGFASNAKLVYSYYSTTSDRGFQVVGGYWGIDIPVRLDIPHIPEYELEAVEGNVFQKAAIRVRNAARITANLAIGAENLAIDLVNLIYQDNVTDSFSPLLRVEGAESSNMSIKIVVRDDNSLSSTYNKSCSVTISGFQTSDLSKDVGVPYAMFVGDSETIFQLLEDTGIGHINGCEYSHLNSLDIQGGADNAVSVSDNVLTALNPGIATMSLSVTKDDGCTFHPGQTGSGTSYIYVFKKPTITPIVGGFVITNTQKGVIYSAGSASVTCSEDDEEIRLTGLAPETTYDLTLAGKLPDGRYAKKHFAATTPSPYHGYLRYSSLNGLKTVPDLVITDAGTKSEYPQEPTAYGHILTGWYDDAALTVEHDFDTPVNSDFTIYGKWEALKSSVTLTLSANDGPITGDVVELYQNGESKHTLAETGTAGSYYIADAVTNGTYRIVINGIDTKQDVTVESKQTSKTITAQQYEDRLSGDNIKLSVDLLKLSVITNLDGVATDIDGISYKDKYGFTGTFHKNSESTAYVYLAQDADYDVFHNGSDTDITDGSDASKNVGYDQRTTTLDFYTVSAVLKTDDADWTANAVLRDKNGAFRGTLNPGEYDTGTGTRTYSLVMIADENDTPTDLYIYVDGNNTGTTVTATAEGKKAQITFITSDITLTQDGAAKTDAEISLSNGVHSYSIQENTDGVYCAHVIDDNVDYTMSVVGVTDTETHTITADSSDITIDFFTQTFMTSEGSTYNSTRYRTFIVRSGELLAPPKGAYFSGLTFVCWNTAEYAPDETKQISYDFSTPVSSALTFYAHFMPATVEINGFVKDGDSYTMPNIAVTGYDSGKVISSVKTQFANIQSVALPADEGVTFTALNGTIPEAQGGYVTFTEDNTVGINFSEKLSTTEIQNYLRRITVTPKQSVENTISFTVSDNPVAVYEESSWDYTPETLDESWQVISEGSTTGLTLTSGKYYISQDVAFSCENGNGIIIDGNVTIYIPEGVTLTATGANGTTAAAGNVRTPAGTGIPGQAAILVENGNSLTILGKGTVNATGGNAANGGNAGTAQGANVSYPDAYNGEYIVGRVYGGAGGAGGTGGGGAGAGIGTNGGSGGIGGYGGTGYDIRHARCGTGGSASNSGRGGNGAKGSNGSTANATGTIQISNSLILQVSGGLAGTAGGSNSSHSGNFYVYNYDGHYWGINFVATCGAGGGGGGAGYAASAIGTGGGGGAGGGGGGAGGGWVVRNRSISATFYTAYGGAGGAGAVNGGSTSSNGHAGSDPGTPTSGGAGGAGAGAGTAIAEATYLTSDPQYTITFDATAFGGEKTETTYDCFTAKNIIVPDCIVPQGLNFKGWTIVVGGNNLNLDGEVTALTVNDTTLYQPSDIINLSAQTSGNIVFKPLYEKITAKTADGSLTIPATVFVPDAPEINYYTYTVTTKLDGTAQDLGNVVLKNGTDVYEIGSDGNGTYSLTIRDDETFDVYIDGVSAGVTVSAGETVTVSRDSLTVNVLLDGVASGNVGEVYLKGSDLPSAVNGTETGVYKFLTSNSNDAAIYEIYIGNKKTGISISPGGTATVSYTSVQITFSGNKTPQSAVLRNSDGKEITLNIGSETLSAIAQSDERSYELLIDGLPTGKSFTLAEPDKTIAVNEIIVSVAKDGESTDLTLYVPSYNGHRMEKTSTGVYKETVFGDVGDVTVYGRTFTPENGRVSVNLYSVTYDIGEASGTKPVYSELCFAGDSFQITDDNKFFVEGKEFAGWSYNGNIYAPKATIQNVSSAVNLVANFKDASEFDAIITIGSETHYVMADQIGDYLNSRSGNEGAEIVLLKTASLPSFTLSENDTLTIKAPAVATIEEGDTIVNNGKITIEQGAELIVKGNLINNSQIINNGTTNVSGNGSFVNGKNGQFTNNGKFVFEGQKFENNGTFVNNKDLVINNNNAVNNGILNNQGTLSSESDPVSTLDNNGAIQSSGGTISLTVDNNDGIVNGGQVGTDGMVIGGTTDRIDGNESGVQETKKQEEAKKQEEEKKEEQAREDVKGQNAAYYLMPEGGTTDGIDYEQLLVTPDTYVQGTEKALPIPYKQGYDFVGWCKTIDLSDEPVLKISADDYGELIFFAKYKTAERKVSKADTEHGSFTVSSGTVVPETDGSLAKVAYGEKVTITPTPDARYNIDTVKYNDGTDHIITYDNGYSFVMGEKDVTVTVTFKAGKHVWDFSADGNKIIAKCKGEEAGCDMPPACDRDTDSTAAVLALNAEDAVYDGKAYDGAYLDKTVWEAEELTVPIIKYSGRNGTKYDVSETAPTNVGSYTASITYEGVTATKDFEITKAEISIKSVTVAGKTYDGTDTAEISDVIFAGLKEADTLTDGTDFTVTGVFDKNDSRATKATVTVVLKDTVAANNYKIAGTKDFAGTITRADQTLSFETASTTQMSIKDKTYSQSVSGAQTDVTYSSSAPEIASVNVTTGEVTINDDNTTGIVTITASAAQDDRYKAASATYTITVTKDTVAPDCEIKTGESSIKKFLNEITFGLFFKDTKLITITAKDEDTGVDKIYYYVSDEILSEQQVKDITDWTKGDSVTLNPEGKYVVYVKVTDVAGNITLAGSDGLVVDSKAPEFTGIESGKTYCAAQKFTVTDSNLKSVKLDDTPMTAVGGEYTLPADGESHSITATDNSGNTTVITDVKANDGHTKVIDARIEAGCLTDGKTEGAHCSVCEEILKAQETIPATGHDYSGSWTVTKSATADEKGTKETECLNGCGHKKIEEIPAKGTASEGILNKYADVASKAPVESAILNNSESNLLDEAGIFTQDEADAIKEGADASVFIKVTAIDQTQLSDEDKESLEEAAQNALGEGASAVYLDISLFKKTEDGEEIAVHETDEGVEITLKLTDDMLCKEEGFTGKYRILRLHNGTVDTIKGTYNSETNEFTFVTNMFSTYSIIRSEEKMEILISTEGNATTLKNIGDTLQLNVVVTPESDANQKVRFTSSDKSVVTVDGNGLVTAVGNGTATIAVMTADGTVVKTINVTVKAKTPNTGDSTNIFFWLGLMVMAMAGFGLASICLKRKNRKTSR